MNDNPLGRGLSSLIPKKPTSAPIPRAVPPPPAVPLTPVEPRPVMPVPRPTPTIEPAPAVKHPAAEHRYPTTDRRRLFDIPVDLIDPNPHQPRYTISSESLAELVNSIRQHGILQPLIVTRQGERYLLIAGERRLRAAQQLGLPAVPCLIRESQELERLELAIVENVQRENLNPVEEARAYQQLAEEFGLTQEEIAAKVGKRRTTVANSLRLLTLPADMQQAIKEEKITASHAKILLAAVTPQDRDKLFEQILSGRLPVRAAAQLGQRTTVRRHIHRSTDPSIRAWEDELRTKFGTKVKISKRDNRGSISIEFYSEEEFQQILDRLR